MEDKKSLRDDNGGANVIFQQNAKTELLNNIKVTRVTYTKNV